MFDPERDEDAGARPFLARLAAVVLISVAACAALLPSVTGFNVGVDQEKGCLAIVDGWHADRPGLSAAEKNAAATGFVGEPSAEQEQLLEHAQIYLDWRNGAGACVPDSRHRLIISGLGLSALAATVGFALVVRRTRKNLRRSPAQLAEV
jgi:hypothetical protein